MTPTKYTPPKRPVHAVTLPGGDLVHARGLTVGELRRVDKEAAAVADPAERGARTALHLAALALADADGFPWFPIEPATLDHALDQVADLLTADQLAAVVRAAVGDRDEAKNG